MDFEKDPYEVLGIVDGPKATDDEIKKAYRKLALAKHPDKNRDNPNAADEFAALQKAYDVLTDKDARAALDGVHAAKAAREEREANQGSKRRKMREELERREREAASGRSEEQVARARFAAELERLRERAAEKQAQRNQAVHAAAAAAQAAQSAASSAHQEQIGEQLKRSLKVQWNRADGNYSAQELREIFGAVAEVEDVLVRDSKKKKKGSAIVVMATVGGASAAATSMLGRIQNPLLVVPHKKTATVEEAAAEDTPPSNPKPPANVAMPSAPLFPSSSKFDAAAAPAATTSIPSFPSAPVGNAHRDYENVTLMKMRQAAERARLAREMAAEDDG